MALKARVVSWHSTFNLPALLEHGGQLRNIPCTCDVTQRPQNGNEATDCQPTSGTGTLIPGTVIVYSTTLAN